MQWATVAAIFVGAERLNKPHRTTAPGETSNEKIHTFMDRKSNRQAGLRLIE
jgi:hypothetical protein